MSNIDPSLHAQYVSKSDYDTLKARLDATSGDSKHVKSTSLRARKRPRPSVTPVETPGDLRERSSTPMVDEKGRKKRSMKLEVSTFLSSLQRCFPRISWTMTD